MHPTSSDLARFGGHPIATLFTLCAVVAAVACLAAGCDDGVRVSLQLRTAQGGVPPPDASRLEAFTVIIDNGALEDRETFLLDRTAQVVVPSLSVDRTSPFNIEVWGCNSATCDEADIFLRGCTTTALDVSDRSDTVVVTIEMRDVSDDSLRQCPGIAG